MLYPNLLRVLNDLSEQVVKDYQKGLMDKLPHRNGDSYDKIASGDLYRSTNCIVKQTITGFEVYFSALNNWINVEFGRKAGKGVRPEIIEKWVNDRNIKPYDDISEKSMKYLINRSIKEHGIIPRPILGKIERELNSWDDRIMDAANEDIFGIISTEFETQMTEIVINTDTSLLDKFLNITIKTI